MKPLEDETHAVTEPTNPDLSPALRLVATPADTNADGDIFGGWLMAQVDIAGSLIARERARRRIVTAAADRFHFLKPVFVGDLLSFYARLIDEGRTSMRVKVEVFAQREPGQAPIQVADAELVYVAIDEERRPTPLK